MPKIVRIAWLLFLGLLLGFPLCVLFRENLSWHSLGLVRQGIDSFDGPLANTFSLIALVILLTVPTGTVYALLVCHPGVRGRRGLGACVVAGLFVPLPVWAVSWQIVFGDWLPPPTLEPGQVAWRPWKLGLLPAAWIHAVAAWPWVVAIIWIVLRTGDRSLEDEARQTGGWWGLFRWVVAPRLAWAVLLAATVVGMQAGTEIAVTDAMMVRTVAEEVYTQMVVRGAGLEGAIAATVPVWLGKAVGLAYFARLALRRFRTSSWDSSLAPKLRARGSPTATAAAWAVVSLHLGIAIVALGWKAAGGGVRPEPSFAEFGHRLDKALRTEWLVLIDSLAAALAAGAFTASLAWVTCGLAFGSARYRATILLFNLLLLALPGPLAGFAVKQATVALAVTEQSLLRTMDLHPEFPPLRSLLYDQPTPVPGIWVCALRFFPLACGMMAVALQRIPRSQLENAAVEGRSGVDVWRWVLAPHTARPFLLAALAVAALAFGEVSASKLAQPPSRGVFVLRLFDQMHYGAESTVAALCLLQMAATGLILVGLIGLRTERTA